MMKTILAAAIAAVLATGASAESHADAHGTHIDLEDVQWEDPGIPGVGIALAWGSEEAGDAVWLFRMEPGAQLPMHGHTNDYWGITIQGDWVHIHEDRSEKVSGPGGYAFVKGGDLHADACASDIPCIGLLDFNGVRDVYLPN